MSMDANGGVIEFLGPQVQEKKHEGCGFSMKKGVDRKGVTLLKDFFKTKIRNLSIMHSFVLINLILVLIVLVVVAPPRESQGW